MQHRRRVSLNAVRIFTLAAHHLSLANAADEAGVTPSAVSHQIKKLEGELGTPLFERSANSIRLTEAGRRFHEETSVAVAMIDRSAEALTRDGDEIVVRVSISLAVRWLIPALERFRETCPDVRVRVETMRGAAFALGSCDVAVAYHRAGTDETDGEHLIADRSLPVASPGLLASVGYRSPADIGSVPAIRATVEDWDWTLWAQQVGLNEKQLSIRHAFDSDDAALHAAVAGLGMALAPPLMIERERKAGTLVPLSGFEPVELGTYRLLTRDADRRVVRRFAAWLRAEIARFTP